MALLASMSTGCDHPATSHAPVCSCCGLSLQRSGEELQICEQCSKPVCSDCLWNRCEACDVNMCDNCNAGCERCQEDVCRICKDGSRCDACGDEICVVCEIEADVYTGEVQDGGESLICGMCEKLFAERDLKNKKLCRGFECYVDLLRRLDVIAHVKDVDVNDPRYFGPLPLPKVAEPGQLTIHDYVHTKKTVVKTMKFEPPKRLRSRATHKSS